MFTRGTSKTIMTIFWKRARDIHWYVYDNDNDDILSGVCLKIIWGEGGKWGDGNIDERRLIMYY